MVFNRATTAFIQVSNVLKKEQSALAYSKQRRHIWPCTKMWHTTCINRQELRAILPSVEDAGGKQNLNHK